MTKALKKQEGNQTSWSPEQIQLITNTVAKGATPDELKLFLYTASRTGLDPLTKQIHFVKRKIKNSDGTYREQMTIQTGIDGYRAIAERSGTLAGIDDVEYDNEDKEHPNKATVTVYRIINGERVPFTASARWNEYAPQGNQAFMWNKMPYLMLGKCAEALALRKAFPNDLTGLYTNEEMDQAENPVRKIQEEKEEVKVEDVEKVMEGEVVYEPVEKEQNDKPKKQCPFCGSWHTGQYAKCFSCWKEEKAGKTLVKHKTVVNTDAPPF